MAAAVFQYRSFPILTHFALAIVLIRFRRCFGKIPKKVAGQVVGRFQGSAGGQKVLEDSRSSSGAVG